VRRNSSKERLVPLSETELEQVSGGDSAYADPDGSFSQAVAGGWNSGYQKGSDYAEDHGYGSVATTVVQYGDALGGAEVWGLDWAGMNLGLW
jgi:hypothetical protein